MKYLFFLNLFLYCFNGFAQKTSHPSSSNAAVVYEKKTKLDFEDRNVDGEFLTPDGQSVNAEKNLSFDSMLEPKDNFKSELKRSMGVVR